MENKKHKEPYDLRYSDLAYERPKRLPRKIKKHLSKHPKYKAEMYAINERKLFKNTEKYIFRKKSKKDLSHESFANYLLHN